MDKALRIGARMPGSRGEDSLARGLQCPRCGHDRAGFHAMKAVEYVDGDTSGSAHQRPTAMTILPCGDFVSRTAKLR